MGARFDDPVRYKQGRPAGLLKRGKLEKHTHVKTVRGNKRDLYQKLVLISPSQINIISEARAFSSTIFFR